MSASLSIHAWVVLGVLVASFALFVTEAVRYEIVALAAVLVLVVTGCMEHERAFAAFAAPAAVMVASMYVFAHAIARWGVAEAIGRRCLEGGRSERSLVLRVTLLCGLLSTVVSDTAVTAAMLPVVHSAARRAGVPASKLLIPLSFGSLLGGMVTVIGTSSNMAMNDMLVRLGEKPFGLFEFSALGLILLGLGVLYFVGPGRALLPATRERESLSEHYRVPRFSTEVSIEAASPLTNRSVRDLGLLERHEITLLGIVRAGGEGTLLAPGPYNRIRPGDTLILQGAPESILRLRAELGLRASTAARDEPRRLASADVQLVEAVVPSGSELVGRTLIEADVRATTGLNVLALSKHGEIQPVRIGRVRLGVGDTLLVQGHAGDIERMRASGQLVVLSERALRPEGHGAGVVIAVFALVLLLSGLGVAPLPVCALGGALTFALSGVVEARAALRAIDWSVVLLVGGLLAVAQAFDEHGLGDAAARAIAALAGTGASPTLLLALVALATMILTQVTTNVSSAVIMAPVAVSLAADVGVSARPLLVAVLLGASCAFLSPVGHQANAMVAGPGEYRFVHFLRVGAPLSVLIVIAMVALIPLFWPFDASL